ncbi:MAG: hypothetical protein U5K54_24710 [Cytophagales bacterium]|nr:hypothetical protein [Cytophagales bacterium]
MSDGAMHPDEERVILEKMNKHFPNEGDHKKKFDEAVIAYKKGIEDVQKIMTL